MNLTPLTRLAAALMLLLSAHTASAQTYSRKTNLPAMYINTFNNAAITSKEDYIYSTLRYVGEDDEVTQYDSVSIRGRGNSTWNLSKKPYRIKFLNKEKFLGKGYAKAKKWTLLANAADKTMMRNAVTSRMGELMGLDFNPAYRFVDLILNNTYLGTYQISDQVEVRKHRVDVEEQDYPLADTTDITGGYLLEVDGFFDGFYFETMSKSVPVRVHYPDEDEIALKQKVYIKDYVNAFETTLFSSSFDDTTNGYRALVDTTSLIDWYLATEISGNIDGFFSTYFYKHAQDPRLYWGPLWDYDVAYANDTRKGDTRQMLMTEEGYGKTKEWVNRMWSDKWFANRVNARYKELVAGGLEKQLHAAIDSLSQLLDASQQLNYKKWGINRKMYHETVLYSSFSQYVSDLKSYITSHMAWLTTAFANKKPTSPTPEFEPERAYYRLLNAGCHNALDVSGNSDKAGALVCTWELTDDRESQQWVIKAVGDYFHLTNRHGAMALNDPTTGTSTATTNVGTQLNTAKADTLDDRQLWTFTPQGTAGYYNLVNKHTQHTANLSGGNSTNGAKVLSYTTNDANATSNNRLWYIVAGEALPDPSDGIAAIEPDAYALAYNPQLHLLHFGADDPAQLNFLVTLTAASGRRMATFRASDSYDATSLPKGVYLVTWHVGGKTRSAKFAR